MPGLEDRRGQVGVDDDPGVDPLLAEERDPAEVGEPDRTAGDLEGLRLALCLLWPDRSEYL